MRDLSSAIFERVEADVTQIQQYHSSSGAPQALTEQELGEKGPQYWNKRARRLVRSKDPLKRELRAVLDKYKQCIDPMSGLELLTPVDRAAARAGGGADRRRQLLR